MSQTAVTLIVLAALLSAVQWVWTRMATHVDLHLMPVHSRRRVQWLLANSMQVQLIAALVVVAAVGVQAASMLG